MTLTWEDRLKVLLMPGWIYYQRKLASEARKGEPEITILPELLLSRGKVAVDVGANRGIYSYLLSRHFDRVIAFEPNPELARFGRRMLPSNTEVVETALGAHPANAELRIPPGRKRGEDHLMATLSSSAPAVRSIPVHVRTLDSMNLEGVGFIKIDVEGTEVEVLEGARETIQSDRPLMMVELLAGLYDSPARVVQELCVQYGYQARILSDDGLVDALGHLQAGLPVSSRNVLFFPHE